MVYLSIFTTFLSGYSGFLYKLTVYLYKHKRLHHLESSITLGLGNEQIENYGFKHIRRILSMNDELRMLKVSGTNMSYFDCNQERLDQIKGLMKVTPNKETEFFEINKCNFSFPYEPRLLFNILRNRRLFQNLRYVSISRCKLCQGFILPALTSFLNDDKNMVRFSFILNHQSRSVFDFLNEDEE